MRRSMMDSWSVQTMDCERVTEALYLSRQGLESNELVELDHHLERCPSCARTASHTVELLRVIQRAPRTPAPEHLRLRILQIFEHRKVASGS